MEDEEDAKENQAALKKKNITLVLSILHHAQNSEKKSARMYDNHSSRNGMRMQLAWWDIVDIWTYI